MMVREREQDDISTAFNDAHREGPNWYRWADLDAIYYRHANGGDIYLLVERICIKKDGVQIDRTIPDRYPLIEHKKNTFIELSDLVGDNVPFYIVWHREDCQKFAVKPLATGSVRILEGWSEYWNWLDSFRLKKVEI